MNKYGEVRKTLIVSTAMRILRDFGLEQRVKCIKYGYSLIVGEYMIVEFKNDQHLRIVIDEYNKYYKTIELKIVRYWRAINGR